MLKRVIGLALAITLFAGETLSVPMQTYAVEKKTEKVIDGNDSYDSATFLDVNGNVTEILSDNDDVDYYQLHSYSNGTLSIYFQHTYEEYNGGWKVAIYKYENGEYVQLSENVVQLNANENLELPFVGMVSDATYYIKVERQYWESVGKSYSIRTSFQATEYCEKETNDSYATATKIGMGYDYAGVLNSNSDEDIYRLDATQDGKISLNFSHIYMESSAGWNVQTYKYENGEYVELSDTNIQLNSGENVSIPYIGANQGGIYYIRVKRIYWDSVGVKYMIKPVFQASNYYEKETNDTYVNATNINIGSKYRGVLNRSEDSDYWKFETDRNGAVDIYFDHEYEDSSAGWNVYVYEYTNGEYKELDNKMLTLRDGSKSQKIFRFEIDKNQIYYIKVTRYYWDSVGCEYAINVKYTLGSSWGLTCKTNKKSATLKWGNTWGAQRYEVYCKNGGGSYKKIADTSKKSYTYKKLSKKKYSYFKVRPYMVINGKKVYGKYSLVVKTRAR